jgi:chromosome segregation ATPase
MKFTIVALAATSLLTGALVSGCASTSNQSAASSKQEARESRAEYRAEWRAFKKDSEQKIDANQVKIDAFKEKMENAGPERREKYGDRVAKLEQKNRDLRRQLAEYKDGGPSKWEEFKTNFKHDMDGIGETMSDLFKGSD